MHKIIDMSLQALLATSASKKTKRKKKKVYIFAVTVHVFVCVCVCASSLRPSKEERLRRMKTAMVSQKVRRHSCEHSCFTYIIFLIIIGV